LLDKIDQSVKASRDLLLGVFHDNPKELTQWGFNVSDTARAAAKKKEQFVRKVKSTFPKFLNVGKVDD